MAKKNIYKQLFELFSARQDVYATCWYNKNEKRYAYKSVKSPYTVDILKEHIENKKSLGIGIYPLLEGNKTKWISADIDFHSE